MSGATSADLEQKRREISNLLVSLKYAIAALEDWQEGEDERDDKTKRDLEMFNEIKQELQKPYHPKTAGLPSPKTNDDVETKKDLFGDNSGDIVESLEDLHEKTGKMMSDDDCVDERQIDEMIEKASEIGTIMHKAKP